MYRHGDLLIVRAQIPTTAKAQDSNILAYGEVTGHAHRLNGGTMLLDGADTYISALNGAALTHDEHATIALPPDTYRVIRQREWNPYERAMRNVAD